MPRFSQQVLGALANPQYGMLTGQAIANVGGRVAQIPGNIREGQQQRDAQSAYQTGIAGLRYQDPAAIYNASQKLIAAGQPEQAMQMAGLAQETSVITQAAARTEALRTNLKSRVARLPGLSYLDIDNASAEQLESMRVRVANAEQEQQLSTDLINKATAAAEAAEIDSATVDLFQNDAEGLLELSREVIIKRQLIKIDRMEEDRQAQAQATRAKEKGMPESFVKDVEEGFYVGRNADFADILSGKALSQKDFLVVGGEGTPIRYPTLGGKVLIDNKFFYPNEANLVEAPSVTAETLAPDISSQDKKMLPFAANAAGIAIALVNNLDNVSDFNSKLSFSAGESLPFVPFKSDYARDVAAFQEVIPDVLSRTLSGAAIKDDEFARYVDMFTPSFSEVTSPLRAAEKLIRSAALVSYASKAASGEVDPKTVREMVEKMGSITFTEEEEKEIRDNKKGSLKRIVKKYTDKFLSEGDASYSLSSRVDSILQNLNTSVGG